MKQFENWLASHTGHYGIFVFRMLYWFGLLNLPYQVGRLFQPMMINDELITGAFLHFLTYFMGFASIMVVLAISFMLYVAIYGVYQSAIKDYPPRKHHD